MRNQSIHQFGKKQLLLSRDGGTHKSIFKRSENTSKKIKAETKAGHCFTIIYFSTLFKDYKSLKSIMQHENKNKIIAATKKTSVLFCV